MQAVAKLATGSTGFTIPRARTGSTALASAAPSGPARRRGTFERVLYTRGSAAPQSKPRAAASTNAGGSAVRKKEDSKRPVAKPVTMVKRAGRVRRSSRVGESVFSGVMFLAILCAGALLFGVSQRVLIAQDSIELEKLNSSITDTRASHEKLVIAVQKMEAPERIAAMASKHLEMVRADKILYLTVPRNLKAVGGGQEVITGRVRQVARVDAMGGAVQLLENLIGQARREIGAMSAGGSVAEGATRK